MSWLKKIVSTLSVRTELQPAQEVADVVPAEAPLKAVAATGADTEPGAEAQDESSSRQRRYFVKKGLYVDNEEERAAARVVESTEEIPDRRPPDLKSLFPKLSLR